MRIFARLLLALVVIGIAVVLVVLGTYFETGRSNNNDAQIDAIVVLGTPTLADGTPSPELRERVMEGVREYKAGVARHMIMTGAAAHNRFVEAHAMALLAEANGVPASAVMEESQAQNTIQNIYYSDRILEANGWKSVEVVSSPSHLPRTALILQRFPLRWRTHDAKWPPEYPIWKTWLIYWYEAVGVARIRLHGFPHSKFMPAS